MTTEMAPWEAGLPGEESHGSVAQTWLWPLLSDLGQVTLSLSKLQFISNIKMTIIVIFSSQSCCED